MGLYSSEVNQLILDMMNEDLLNEERYVRGFARGHFYQKNWGWKKIEMALKQQGAHHNILKLARAEIDQEDYMKTLRSLASKKWNSLKHEQYINRKAKTYRYLVGKGYETNLIKGVIAELSK